MSRHDILIQHIREIIVIYSDVLAPDDRKALWKYQQEFKDMAEYLECEERKIIECHKILSRTKEKFLASTPAWVRNGIQNAMAELRKP